MKNHRAGSASYQDPLVAIQHGTLVIRRYYFPTGVKRIRLEAISGAKEYAMTRPPERGGSGVRGTSSTGQPGPGSPPQAAGVHRRPRPKVQAGHHPR
jgi:hypothetical protein